MHFIRFCFWHCLFSNRKDFQPVQDLCLLPPKVLLSDKWRKKNWLTHIRVENGHWKWRWLSLRYTLPLYNLITFCGICRWHEMYVGHACLVCVCLSIPRRMPILLLGHRCYLGEWLGVPSSCALLCRFVVHQFHCYDNVGRTWNVSECLYLPLCLVLFYYADFVCHTNKSLILH